MSESGEKISCGELAARIGPRRAGRPTSRHCVYRWIRTGVAGVRLRCVEEVGIYLTTWQWYEQFKAEVSEARAARRRRGLGAVEAVRDSNLKRRAAKAMKALAEMDARRR